MDPDGTRTALDLLGVPAVVSSTDPQLTALLRRLWAPFLTDEPADPDVAPLLRVGRDRASWHVQGPTATTTTSAPEQVLSEVATAINGHALGGTRHFATHAAVVAAGARCVALVAMSGTGKSTLTAALLQRGMDYVSDEALVLRADGGVVAYPRPLGLLPWTRRALGVPARWSPDEETQVSPAEMGARVRLDPPPPTDVVLLRREPGALLDLQEAQRQQVAAELLRRSFNHHRDPAAAFGLAHRLVAAARAWVLTVGDPRATAGLLVDRLGLQPEG